MTTQISQTRARYGRIYAIAMTTLAAMMFVGTVWAGNNEQTMTREARMDVVKMMVDADKMLVHTITDAF